MIRIIFVYVALFRRVGDRLEIKALVGERQARQPSLEIAGYGVSVIARGVEVKAGDVAASHREEAKCHYLRDLEVPVVYYG